MKKLWVVIFLLTFASAVTAYAQDTMEMTVPFGFSVGTVSLPAGEYSVKRLSRTMINVVQVRGLNANAVALSVAMPVTRGAIPQVITQWRPGLANTNTNPGTPQAQQPPKQTSSDCSVVFHRYNDTYFMADIWIGHNGLTLSMSKKERALKVAGVLGPVETVLLAAVVR